MKLLISNDDGVFALGIKTLADTLALAGHEVIVVCPDRERSATGHGLTLHDPIRAEEVTGIFHPSVRAWSCSGTPADCVKLALGALLDTISWGPRTRPGSNTGVKNSRHFFSPDRIVESQTMASGRSLSIGADYNYLMSSQG